MRIAGKTPFDFSNLGDVCLSEVLFARLPIMHLDCVVAIHDISRQQNLTPSQARDKQCRPFVLQ